MSEKKPYIYNHWDSLKKEMDNIVHTVNKIPKDDRGQMEHAAYVTRNGGAKNMYEVYITQFAAGKSSLIHEYGHIKFQHLRYEELLIKQVQEKFKAAWPKIEKYIDYDISSWDIKDTTWKNFLHICQNYAMDMEVNSKLFDTSERRRVDLEATKELYSILAYFAEKDRNNFLKKKLSDFIKKFKEDKNALLTKLVWPEDFGFPSKLFWHQYIDLMLQNPEKVLKKLAENLKQKRALEVASDGSRAPERVADHIASNPLKGNGLSAKDIQDIADSLDDIGGNDGELIHPGKTQESKYESTNMRTNNNAPSQRNQLAAKFEVEPLGPCVEKFIQKYTIDEYKEFKTDFLYNYNRGKTTGVMRSKTVENINYYTGNCYIIVDTSGSIGRVQLNQCVGFFKKIKNRIGPKSKVIWFDTDVQRIDKITAIKQAPSGGGNDMGKAIDFVNKWTSKEDICFIISDFYDDPEKMTAAIKKFRGRIYAIKWSSDFEAKEIREWVEKKEYDGRGGWLNDIFDTCRACDDFILVDCKSA